MTKTRLAPPEAQPKSFEFTASNLKQAQAEMTKYPEGRQASAVIALLWIVQEQTGGWIPEPAIAYVAELIGSQKTRVLEVASFYSMFNLVPVGKYFVQVCGTTPCMLCGSEELIKVCNEIIGPAGQVTEDGMFSWAEVECLGACVNAPMVQIGKDYYEDLDQDSFRQLLADLRLGRDVKPGPRSDRQFSAPLSGKTSLFGE